MTLDRFNRQLHDNEKNKAKQIERATAAQGIKNADGSPITAAQIENAMRAANNSQYGELVATDAVVSLNANTPQDAVYDATRMKFVADRSGNYLVQDVSMLATPPKSIRDLIAQSTGGKDSPYSWNPESAPVAAKSKIDDRGPFGPGWNTGEYSAGFGAGGHGILPDYATTGTSVFSATGGAAVNLYDGTTYLSGGVTSIFPMPVWKPGVTGTVGWILGDRSANATNSFLNGDGNQGFISIPTPFKFNVVGAITHAYGGATAIEFGLGTPGGFGFGVTPWSHGGKVISGNGKQ
ncbi:polymorphic toxin type 22 domain-containing protein [Paraburkholderia bonniea]|uniref:polymorphic toxin type 22 domain-containing protein n=1 Tax=Paraburkholderia bonniea TaxID=2152891 RepID=UPI001291FB0D|nr:polymorphic toxin type 22 domain-containing protein [Paraburkholderia bonniea]